MIVPWTTKGNENSMDMDLSEYLEMTEWFSQKTESFPFSY